MARSIDRKRRTALPHGSEAEVIRLYAEDGWSAQRIGNHFGTTFSPIYRILRKHGVTRSKTGERSRKFSVDVENAVIDAFLGGDSEAAAAKRAGMSTSSVSALLKRRGIPSRQKTKALNKADEADIVARYRRGEPAAKIANTYGVFHKRVFHVLDAQQVPRHKPPRPSWSDRLGRNFMFRSDWELRVAKYLDEERIEWDYEVERFALQDGAKRRSYMPDFWIYRGGALTLVDVKGRWSQDQHYRMELFRNQYPQHHLEVWDGGVLRSLGLLRDFDREAS